MVTTAIDPQSDRTRWLRRSAAAAIATLVLGITGTGLAVGIISARQPDTSSDTQASSSDDSGTSSGSSSSDSSSSSSSDDSGSSSGSSSGSGLGSSQRDAPTQGGSNGS
jgi:cytoskeletal protein RodZ